MRPLLDSAPLLGDPAAIRARAEEDGCLFLRGVPGPAAVAPLLSRVLAAGADRGLLLPEPRGRRAAIAPPGARLEGTGYDDPRFVELQARILPTPEFLAVGDDPALLGLLRAILGEPPMTRRGDICRLALPRSGHQTTPPHQDHFYTGGSTRQWTAWIPLVDVPVRLGPIWVAPGSHRSGLLRHEGEGAGRQGVAAPPAASIASGALAAGDAVLFNALTVHGALPNRSARRVRVSADYRYQPASEPVHTRRVDGTGAGPA